MSSVRLFKGNCLDSLKNCKDNSIDSIVTDPPYGLSFMGKAWDYDVPTTEIWKECLRVLKPGGHLLAFGGTRTYHRLVVNIEDAGFEIRDQIMWIYGSGFPKSMDISKAIDKEAGAEREQGEPKPYTNQNIKSGHLHAGHENEREQTFFTKPVTDDAKRWSGYGTALKPANEPICLARKPLSEKTVAKNVLKHGVGGLNVDASRIAHASEADRASATPQGKVVRNNFKPGEDIEGTETNRPDTSMGRFPANILFDEAAAAVLDEQSGVLHTHAGKGDYGDRPNSNAYGTGWKRPVNQKADSGGASRFFKVVAQDTECNANTVKLNSDQLSELEDFVAKLAAISERPGTRSSPTLIRFTREMQNVLKKIDETNIETIQSIVEKSWRELLHTSMCGDGLAIPAVAQKLTDTMRIIQSLLTSLSCAEAVTSNTTLNETAPGGLDLASKFIYVAKASKKDRGEGNIHPTVKPIKLMEYLVKLVTPEGGIVLDPFMGSGTTGVAAKSLGFSFVGCEMDENYYNICCNRIGYVDMEDFDL